jgi:hypothetical protein
VVTEWHADSFRSDRDVFEIYVINADGAVLDGLAKPVFSAGIEVIAIGRAVQFPPHAIDIFMTNANGVALPRNSLQVAPSIADARFLADGR